MAAVFPFSSLSVCPAWCWALLLAVLFALAGCTGSGGTIARPIEARPPASAAEAAAEAHLRTLAQQWLGIPYRFGGENPRTGMDCSAFTRALVGQAYGLSLSRSTLSQVREGREVGRDELQVGDVLFFRTGRGQRHAGVYLGAGQLVHASTSRGVVVDELSGYFDRTWWTARRFLPRYDPDPLYVHDPAAPLPPVAALPADSGGTPAPVAVSRPAPARTGPMGVPLRPTAAPAPSTAPPRRGW